MKKLIHFFGLKRSGNHSIINWIFEGVDNKKTNCVHYNDIFGRHDDFPEDISIDNLLSIKQDDFFWLLSYEDVDISSYLNFPTILNDNKKDIEEISILILRDPFNFFASRFKRLENLKKINSSLSISKVSWEEVIRLWKMYAKEYLGETKYLPNKIIINYNLWFQNEEYRKKIIKDLNLEPIKNNLILDKVSKYGRGSSFDFLKYDGRGREMKVLNRWEHFKDRDSFRVLFEDTELMTLSEKIFGEIEGTEIFYKK